MTHETKNGSSEHDQISIISLQVNSLSRDLQRSGDSSLLLFFFAPKSQVDENGRTVSATKQKNHLLKNWFQEQILSRRNSLLCILILFSLSHHFSSSSTKRYVSNISITNATLSATRQGVESLRRVECGELAPMIGTTTG